MKLPGRGLAWKQFLTDLMKEWDRDSLTDVAGSVTFFAMLSMFPFLIFAVSLASVFIDPKDAQALVTSGRHLMPPAVTTILSHRLHALITRPSFGLVTVSALTTIWSASSGVASLMSALNTCYGVRESRPFWKTRGVAVIVVLLSAVISLVAAFAAVALPPILNYFGGSFSEVIGWLRLPAAAVLMMFLWAVIYYVLPDVEQRFKFITPGSVVGVLLWLLASWLFSVYVTHFGHYDVIYGTLGGVVILQLWMWISVLTLLLGALVNAVIEHRSPEGKRTGARSMSETGEDVPAHEKDEHPERATPAPVPEPTASSVLARSAKNAAWIAGLGMLWRILLRRRPA